MSVANEIGQIKSLPQSSMELLGPNQREFKTDPVSILRLFVLPIVVILVFVFFLIVGIIPNIGLIFAELDETSQLSIQYEKLTQDLIKLDSLASNTAELDNNLALINRLAAHESKTAVVAFQDKVTRLAGNLGLSSSSQQLLEKIVTHTSNSETKQKVSIIEIPATFTFAGRIDRIRAFMIEMRKIDDLLTISEMNIGLASNTADAVVDLTTSNWQLQLKLSKFQFLPTTIEDKEAYEKVPLDAKPDDRVIKYLEDYRSN